MPRHVMHTRSALFRGSPVARTVHVLALLFIGYRMFMLVKTSVKTIAALPPAGAWFMVGYTLVYLLLWSMLAWNLHRWPHKWGWRVGAFILLGVALNAILLASQGARSAATGTVPDWSGFGLNILPALIAAACCISLRWLCPAQSKGEAAAQPALPRE